MGNPAEEAAARTQAAIHAAIEEHKNFLVEAGAGAGKTFSLIEALKFLIEKRGKQFLREGQQVACITYTNVARDEITSRTDGHPAVLSSTIHAFCWSLIRPFQPALRIGLAQLPKWQERLAEAGETIGSRSIDYELGYPAIEKGRILLGHNDVLELIVQLLGEKKFRNLISSRHPILFIDEYQDTNAKFAEALKTHFIESESGPLIGFFGDHWQKIYGDGCGRIEHPKLRIINKEANFRSVRTVVEVLNRIRPDLRQAEKDPNSMGSVTVYHTNAWAGTRLTKQPWKDDLPADAAHAHLNALKEGLAASDWDFSPDVTKILMLTHAVLAKEQGYGTIAEIFQGRTERFIKKEEPHLAFFADTIEPVCSAYERKRYGEMFAALGGQTPPIHAHSEKVAWAKDMDALLKVRAEGSVRAVIDLVKGSSRIRLPEAVERKEQKLTSRPEDLKEEEQGSIDRLRKLMDVPYREVVALSSFVEDRTPFSTKHGVKGAEFENVLVVFGRGWNLYDFNQFLEWSIDGIPADKQDSYERNRNLFYVACSRPKKRLALLFTQKLSGRAIAALSAWFGQGNIREMALR